VSTKERQAIEYRQKLISKWSSTKDVRAVHERRHVPTSIHNATSLKRDMVEAIKGRDDRRRKHSRQKDEKPKAERKSKLRDIVCFDLNLADVHQGLSSWSRSNIDVLGYREVYKASLLLYIPLSLYALPFMMLWSNRLNG
jgi:hypothetical protein